MLKSDVTGALKARITTGFPTTQILYPNVEEEPLHPRLEMSFQGWQSTGQTLLGGEVERATGIIAVVVCIEKDADGGEDTGNALAETLKALFPEGLQLSITGGEISISQLPNIADGFPDDTSFRIPVTIQYRANSI